MRAAPILAVALSLLACDERRHHPKPAPSIVSGDVPPTTPMVVTPDSAIPVVSDRPASYAPPAESASAPSDEDIAKLPAEEDYEATAEKEITARNARAALQSLEREIER